MTSGPHDSPRPGEEPDDSAPVPPEPGDVYVAGTKIQRPVEPPRPTAPDPEPADWTLVPPSDQEPAPGREPWWTEQGTPFTDPHPTGAQGIPAAQPPTQDQQRGFPRPPDIGRPHTEQEPPQTPVRPLDIGPPRKTEQPPSAARTEEWMAVGGLTTGEGLPPKEEPTRPPAPLTEGAWTVPAPDRTRPDATARVGRHVRPEPTEKTPTRGLATEPPRPSAEDAERGKAQVDAFVAEFVGSATWKATLAVLESAFPGLGMATTFSRRTEDVWRAIGGLDRASARKLGLPVWADGAGMVFDLSAHRRTSGGGGLGRPRASRPYAGAYVIDTLDPLRYHRAVGGPQGPLDGPRPQVQALEEDDTGVVIVADLTAARVRILDSVELWRFAGRVVTATLHEPARPETRMRTRRALRALRRVVFVDPRLGLGVCLQIDAARTPRCLLAFAVDKTESGAPRFVRV